MKCCHIVSENITEAVAVRQLLTPQRGAKPRYNFSFGSIKVAQASNIVIA
jgi:hypothetical protein